MSQGLFLDAALESMREKRDDASTKRDSVLSSGSLQPSHSRREPACACPIAHDDPSKPARPIGATQPQLGVSSYNDNITRGDIPLSVTIPIRACACLYCAPHFYAETIHANELATFQWPFTRLKLFQYDCLQLAKLAIESFNPSFLRKLQGGQSVLDWRSAERLDFLNFSQRHARQDWKEWHRDAKMQKQFRGVNLRDKHAWSLIQKPVEMLNQLFFLGVLPMTSSGDLDIVWKAPGSGQRGASHTIPEGKSTIWINPNHPSHFLNPGGLFNTLLHELCHVFLQRHSCYAGGAKGCDGNQMCVELCQENYGFTSHGRAWQMLVGAIQEAAPKLLGAPRVGTKLLGRPWKVDLGRDECVVAEIAAGRGKGWWPSKCDLKSFGEDFGWRLRPLLRSRGQDDAATFRKGGLWAAETRPCPRKKGRRNSI